MKHQKDDKTVFLTFDDGIQPGTSQTLEVLDFFKIPATYFITGIHTLYTYNRDTDHTLTTLAYQAKRHLIGNHSFSHCHGCYKSYYQHGLLVNNEGRRMTAAEDFCKNTVFINGLLEEAAQLSFEDRIPLGGVARLPGRNSWLYHLDPGDNTRMCEVINCEPDSIEAARGLSDNNWQIFGWDEEWRMSFDFASEACKIRTALQESGSLDFSDPAQLYPDFDMLAPENAGKDRLIESCEEMVEKILRNPKQNIVLLMHDRAFREYPDRNSEQDQLGSLITGLMSAGVTFSTLDKYRNTRYRAD